MEPYFNTMLIEKYVTRKGFRKHTESDHNTIYADFFLDYIETRSTVKMKIFNFQNQDSMKQFTEFTSNTDKFSRCFDPSKPMKENANFSKL